MKKDIILSGVGGQGILTIAYVLGSSALKDGFYFKQSEVHGMSQRGGAVESHLRIKDKEIYSPLIPKGECDIILSVEPIEALRYLPFLSKDGYVISNSIPYKNIPDYPEEEKIKDAYNSLKNGFLIEAEKLAKEAGSPRSANIVMVGVASNLLFLKEETLLFFIEKLFEKKGEKVVSINKKAFHLGREEGKKLFNGK
jgi:indolepyruvate ferredoxin oxidoreductase beta subunit